MIHSSNQKGREEELKSKVEVEIREEISVERQGEGVDQIHKKRFQGKDAKGEDLNHNTSREKISSTKTTRRLVQKRIFKCKTTGEDFREQDFKGEDV